MNYRIALSPELPLDTQDFVTFWNETEACRALAEARVSTAQPKGFPLDPALLQQGLVLLVGAAGGLALNALQDALQEQLTAYFKEKLSPKPRIKVNSIRQPDGSYLLVVTEE
jgi:hypothetical protein